MKRRNFSSFLSIYLFSLFFIFFAAGGLFVLLGHTYYLFAGMGALFAVVAVPLFLWVRELEKGVEQLDKALIGIRQSDWNFPLPSTGIKEIWEWISSFHETRSWLKERIASLEGEREKLSRVLSNLKEGILVADPANRVLMANEAVGSFLDIPSSDLIDKSLDAFVEGDLSIIFSPLIKGEEEARIVSMFGPEKIFFFRSFFPKNAEGDLVAKGMVLRDVTESQRLEELRRAFVANASHELRSPAAGLQALLDAFEVGGLEDGEKRKKFVSMMGREVSRLSAIIQDLLDLSEMEREKEFPKEPLNIARLFEEWLNGYESRIREKNLNVSTLFEEKEIVFSGFLPDMERLFRNLFENALKYTPPNGFVEIGVKKDGDRLKGWVKDSGIGIPEEHLSRIFERFYRVDKSRSRAMGGTGLGLSIAKHAVERHGGKIWVESKESQGSAFYFSLPL